MQIPEGEDKGTECIYKAMAENFPNFGREIDIQIHETQKINMLNPNRTTLRYI